MARIILHIDMNAYFASCEQVNNPLLKNKPLVVGNDGRKGVVTTASYEARSFGVKAAMPIFMAKKLCKDLLVVPVNFDLYEKMHQKWFDIIKRHFNQIEVASIDECYVDASEKLSNHKNPLGFIKELQDEILKDSGLKCSIGVASNKFLAKMASDMKKPLGITVIRKKDAKAIIWPLEIGKMFGIGPKTAAKLNAIGISKIGDLAVFNDEYLLKTVLGKQTLVLISKANGDDNEEVIIDRGPLKSVGNSTTLAFNTNDVIYIKKVLRELSESVYERAKEANLVGRGIAISLKDANFKVINRSLKLDDYTQDFEVIYTNVCKLFDQNYNDEELLRQVGVTLTDTELKSNVAVQISIFDQIKQDSIDQVLRRLNQEVGKDIFIKASALIKKES